MPMRTRLVLISKEFFRINVSIFLLKLIVEMEAEVDSFGTPRDANTTPRSPRETNNTNIPSRPVLLTPLNISHRSGISSTEDNSHVESSKRNGVPMWRCFVKNINSAHVLIVLLPASFQVHATLLVSGFNFNGIVPNRRI